MDFIQAIALAIIQAIAEWLPISSSAHLAIADRIFQANADVFYYVILHLATLLSLLIYFRKSLVKFWIDAESKTYITKNGWRVIIATIPVVIAGFFFHDIIESLFTDFRMIGIALIVNAAVLLATSYFKSENAKNDLSCNKSLAIGIMQMLALIPGISRSGITISAGIFAKIKKEELIMFSMMLSIPAIIGAGLYKIVTAPIIFSLPMLVGFIVAVPLGYLFLSLLIKTIRKGTFHDFWVYCLVIGIIMLFN